jgi:hypothetical protein
MLPAEFSFSGVVRAMIVKTMRNNYAGTSPNDRRGYNR